MLIKEDKNLDYNYSFSFKFDRTIVEYCQTLKEKVGFRRFSFFDGKWRFKEIDIAVLLKEGHPEIEIDESIRITYELAQHLSKEAVLTKENAKRLKKALTSNLHINDIKGELFPYQKVGVEFFINNNGKAILADTMGCLSGKTVICVNRRKNARKYTLEEAYIGFNKLNPRDDYGWKYDSFIRSYDEEKKEFKLNKIRAVLFKGKKETIEIKAISNKKTYKIELTPDHEVITSENIWIEAGKLNIGDEILVNGKKVKYCKVCKKDTEYASYKYAKFFGKCRICIYKNFRKNKKNYKGHIDIDGYMRISRDVSRHPNVINKENNNYVYQHVMVMEAYLNNLSYEQWMEKIRINDLKKDNIFINSKTHSIHHNNGVKHDNRLSNLKLLTIKEHLKLEGKKKGYLNFKETFIPEKAKIISIKKKGIQNVYDIVMEDPYRNFIANGIIVHNCGKTLQSLAYVAHTGIKKTLVICPATVKYNWKNEVTKWTKLKSLVIDSDLDIKELMEKFQKYDVFIINYDIIKKYFSFLSLAPWNILIMDEFHYIKNIKAQRTKMAIKIAKRINRLILLSGTPFLSRPIELFNGLHLMDDKTWNDYYSYGVHYCNAHRDRFGWNDRGSSNIPELQERISPYFLRRTKEEILPDLPKKMFVNRPVMLEGEIRSQYKLAEEEFGRFLMEVKNKTDKETKKTMQAEKLAKLGALRMLTSQGKIPAAKELIGEIMDSGEKVVVFSCYNEPLEFLYKEFEKHSVLLTGKTDAKKRGEIIDKFQKNKNCKIFFGGIKSAGVGINLTSATNVLFLDYSWCPADHAQCIDRIHRIGSVSDHITIYQLYSKKTVDEYMYKLLEKKQVLFDQLIEGKTSDYEKNYTSNIIRAIERKEQKRVKGT